MFTWTRPRAVGFVRVLVGSLGRAKELSILFGFVCFVRAYGSSGSFGLVRIHSDVGRVRWVHSGSLWFTQERLGVVGFIRVRMGSLWRAMVSFWFLRVNLCAPRGRRFIRICIARLGSLGRD